MTRFSLYIAILLLISLSLKTSYFSDSVSQEAGVAERQMLGQSIVELLLADGFAIETEPTDSFLPSVAAVREGCSLYITPIPVLKDLDSAFLFASQGHGYTYTYYYDGAVFSEPPIYAPKFWSTAADHMPKIGIQIVPRLRVGVAYSDKCPVGGFDLVKFTARRSPSLRP